MNVSQVYSAYLSDLMTYAEAAMALQALGYSSGAILANLRTLDSWNEIQRAEFLAVNPAPEGQSAGTDPATVEGIPQTPEDVSKSLALRREELGSTREGQGQIFNEYLANMGKNLNTRALSLAGRNFDPLAAQFQINDIVGLSQGRNPQSFRDYLSGDPNPRESRQFFNERFNQLQPLFTADQSSLNPDQGFAREALQSPAVGGDLIRQYFKSGVSPFLSRFVDPVLNRRFNAFEDTADPGTQSLFGEFLRRGRAF